MDAPQQIGRTQWIGQPLRRRDTREHVALYIRGFNAWATDEPLTQLRFNSRDTMPRIAKVR